jgi:hypothetical protein
MQVLAPVRESVIREWFERTLRSYPDQASRFMRGEKDPFRNPVGATFREGLAVLFDELISPVAQVPDLRTKAALDAIVRMRAVQDFTASQAVGFLFELKTILREFPVEGNLAALDRKIDEMALQAFDLYVECREKIFEIKAREARRRVFVPERVHLKRGGTP